FLMDEPLSNLDAKLRVQMRTQVARIQKNLGTTTIYVTHDQTEAMTLGDRVVVMRAGKIQQVGSPTELYDHPTNLFVASFIGSPAMNFLPASIEGETLRTALGDLPLPNATRESVRSGQVSRDVIVGIRPEHFEDASLVAADAPGARVEVDVDIVEEMGSDVYAYFSVADTAKSSELDDLAADAGADFSTEGTQVNARLSAESRVRGGQHAELYVDTAKIQLFDASSGENITAG